MAKEPSDKERKQGSRAHPRLAMTIPVRVDLPGGRESHLVQNQDISWGGVKFLVPKDAIHGVDSVTVTFPWSNGKKISADAEIVRTEQIDDQHALVAARFSSLSTRDQQRLERLLTMLQTTDQAPAESTPTDPMVPSLELLFDDEEEIRLKLAEIARGTLSITVFESYEPKQSIRFVLGGIGDIPALRLRARVEDVDILNTSSLSGWPMYQLRLGFEHPLSELRAAAETLIAELPKRRFRGQEESEGDLEEEV
ncbi:PilZ domain-containing protein [Thioalkalicoccus limnaeus]|uniref:PilZ domain-containing protein n=1 Tax=Thioalkalicoccus limnaeus TaxID=120681 RepID=A0ABV4BB17_9GAMM